MKVVMVGPYPKPGMQLTGGVERVIDTLLPELAEQVDLTLVVPGADANSEYENHGVRTLYVRRGFGPGALRYWTIDAHRVAGILRKLQPDIVHLQGVAGVGRLIDQTAILTVHGIVDRDLLAHARGGSWGPIVRQSAARLLRNIEHRGRKRIGNVIVINPYVLEAMPDVATLRAFHIPNPVDSAFFGEAGEVVASRDRHIVSIGHIGPLKNTLGILKVVARLMEQDTVVSATFCGKPVNDTYLQSCLDFVRSARMESRIRFTGNLPTQEVIRVLDRSSCLVMLSQQENAPMAIAEAHARGVAVVAPGSFGIKHMITAGSDGFFLPEKDLDAQAELLRRALDHSWNRVAMAEKARRAYDPAHIARETIAAYRLVLAA